MKRWILLTLILAIVVQAKVTTIYPPSAKDKLDWRETISSPHIYPGQTITSEDRFLEEPMKPGTSTVRWTSEACYSITLDRVHLMRDSYTLIIKSKYGPDIRMLPFETTKIYLKPNYFKIRFNKTTNTVWLGKYSE